MPPKPILLCTNADEEARPSARRGKRIRFSDERPDAVEYPVILVLKGAGWNPFPPDLLEQAFDEYVESLDEADRILSELGDARERSAWIPENSTLKNLVGPHTGSEQAADREASTSETRKNRQVAANGGDSGVDTERVALDVGASVAARRESEGGPECFEAATRVWPAGLEHGMGWAWRSTKLAYAIKRHEKMVSDDAIEALTAEQTMDISKSRREMRMQHELERAELRSSKKKRDKWLKQCIRTGELPVGGMRPGDIVMRLQLYTILTGGHATELSHGETLTLRDAVPAIDETEVFLGRTKQLKKLACDSFTIGRSGRGAGIEAGARNLDRQPSTQLPKPERSGACGCFGGSSPAAALAQPKALGKEWQPSVLASKDERLTDGQRAYDPKDIIVKNKGHRSDTLELSIAPASENSAHLRALSLHDDVVEDWAQPPAPPRKLDEDSAEEY